jgi:hypothetical protein
VHDLGSRSSDPRDIRPYTRWSLVEPLYSLDVPYHHWTFGNFAACSLRGQVQGFLRTDSGLIRIDRAELTGHPIVLQDTSEQSAAQLSAVVPGYVYSSFEPRRIPPPRLPLAARHWSAAACHAADVVPR